VNVGSYKKEKEKNVNVGEAMDLHLIRWKANVRMSFFISLYI